MREGRQLFGPNLSGKEKTAEDAEVRRGGEVGKRSREEMRFKAEAERWYQIQRIPGENGSR